MGDTKYAFRLLFCGQPLVKKKNKKKQLMFKNLFAYVHLKDISLNIVKKNLFMTHALQFDFSHF